MVAGIAFKKWSIANVACAARTKWVRDDMEGDGREASVGYPITGGCMVGSGYSCAQRTLQIFRRDRRFSQADVVIKASPEAAHDFESSFGALTNTLLA